MSPEATERIHIEHDFDLPAERVFDFFADHRNLGAVFGGKVVRIREGDQEPDGLGSVRKLTPFPGASLEETIRVFERPGRIEYEITRGSPLRDHYGVMQFSSLGEDRSHMDYRIVFDTAIPGLAALVASQLRRAIGRGMKKVEGLA